MDPNAVAGDPRVAATGLGALVAIMVAFTGIEEVERAQVHDETAEIPQAAGAEEVGGPVRS